MELIRVKNNGVLCEGCIYGDSIDACKNDTINHCVEGGQQYIFINKPTDGKWQVIY